MATMSDLIHFEVIDLSPSAATSLDNFGNWLYQDGVQYKPTQKSQICVDPDLHKKFAPLKQELDVPTLVI